MKKLLILICTTLMLNSFVGAQTADLYKNESKEQQRIFGDQGIFEIGGRADLRYVSEKPAGDSAYTRRGSFYLAPQIGYFIIKNLELSVYPTILVEFEQNKEPASSYGMLIAPSYTNYYARPVFPYVELIGGSLINSNSIITTYGIGGGVKIEMLTNALLKIGLVATHQEKESRILDNHIQIEDTLRLTAGFGIFF